MSSAIFIFLFGFVDNYSNFRYNVQLYCKCFFGAVDQVGIIDSLTLGQRTMG